MSGAAAAQEPSADPVVAEREARRAELDALTRQITLTEERQAALRREIAELDQDRASLNRTLIETGQRARRLEGQLDRTEARLAGLQEESDRLKRSLIARRDVLAEVLAALQRMGRKPPPAILVRPEDALGSVRSAILLGAVVPGLRVEAEALAIDLGRQVRLRDAMAAERDRLKEDATALAEDGERIAILIEGKRRARDESEIALEAERQRAATLAGRARNLKELIDSMEREIEAAARAADAARRAEEARAAAAASDSGSGTGSVPPPDLLAGTDRIAPAMAFEEARARLPRPVNGVELRAFGEADGVGGKAEGLSIATRSGARVTTPADGWVVYAGPFRSYGQLLIINAGGGYHVLLAGMERIDVELGQFVLAGEPVAVMGDRRLASAGAVEIGATQPVLYVEFRKDGHSIDPGPWWAPASDEKVGG